ncbi:glycosyltransferase [Cumulibacter soli]|uniref:glycosyltransferase n=1 Tax=Cumulibacter soli TaxID=2546344 RepID=UPI001419E12F|nr:glycosyltransferase [Cumulibacter soli]
MTAVVDLPKLPVEPDTVNESDDSDRLRGYLRELSGGIVVDHRPSGPVFGSVPQRRSRMRRSLVAAMPRHQRRWLSFWSFAYTGVLVALFVWWSWPSHRLTWAGFVANTLLLVSAVALPLFFLWVLRGMRRVNPNQQLPNCRVAMVVTKAPSEPWEMVRRTLEAMLAQEYPAPYDVWIADEAPSDETRAWCSARGVQVSTRHGDERYQRLTWPRRRRCKEGNLAYFYDHYGYERYDVVAQLDSDHVPEPSYLVEMVRPFADSSIGYVAAPSVCDANSEVSWTVPGRPFDEASFHGAQQLGHNESGMPVCIGSHYAVRTQALRQIGGVGPELAEDFTTSYLLNVAGWRGAFAIDAAARGDGPPTFAAMVTQEFQWSRSLIKVMLSLLPRTVGRLPIGIGARFAVQCGSYILLSLMFVGGLALFVIANLTGRPWVSVNLLVFFVVWFVLNGCMLGVAFVLRRARLRRPVDAPIISWRRAVYSGSRYPFVLIGVCAAIWERVVPRTLDFKVTPKGNSGPQPLPVRLILPFLVTAILLAGSAAIGTENRPVVGYVGLSLLGSLSTVTLAIVIALLHAADSRRAAVDLSRIGALRLVRAPLILCGVVGLGAIAATVRYGFELWQVLTDVGLIG